MAVHKVSPDLDNMPVSLSTENGGKRENFLSKKIPMNIFHHISGEGSSQAIRLWVRWCGWLRQPLPEGRDSGRIWSGPGKAKKMAIINMNKKRRQPKKGFSECAFRFWDFDIPKKRVCFYLTSKNHKLKNIIISSIPWKHLRTMKKPTPFKSLIHNSQDTL